MKNLFLFFISACTSIAVFAQDSLHQNKHIVQYYPDGTIRSKVSLDNSKAFGFTQMFDSLGYISEAGYWYKEENTGKYNWIGDYSVYFSTGDVRQSLNYDGNGKRMGLQKYFHPNGIIQKIAFYINGKVDGAVYEFDSLGSLTGKMAAVYDTLQDEPALQSTFSSYPGDSIILDFVKNSNQQIFRKNLLQQSIIDSKLKSEQIGAEQKKNKLYLIFSSILLLALLMIAFFFLQLRKVKKKVELQNAVISHKQKEILDSIRYAKRIQDSSLPKEKYIDKELDKMKST